MPCTENFDPDSKRPGAGSRWNTRATSALVRAQKLPNMRRFRGSYPTSDQHDVVLLLRVQRLHLQRYRLGDEVAQLREALRLLVEKHVDHRLRGEDAEL